MGILIEAILHLIGGAFLLAALITLAVSRGSRPPVPTGAARAGHWSGRLKHQRFCLNDDRPDRMGRLGRGRAMTGLLLLGNLIGVQQCLTFSRLTF